MPLESEEKKLIRAEAEAGKLSHAWLVLSGTRDSRRELAEFIAAALICPEKNAPCGRCPHCRKLQKDIHPDLIRIRKKPDKNAYLVEQARDIVKDSYVMPNEAQRKVYLIEDADEMNISAQNAMLKVLEEPPAHSAFVLTAANSDAVLGTVRSRCTELLAPGEEGPGETDEYSRAIFDAFVSGDAAAVAGAAMDAERAKLEREEFDAMLAALSLLMAGALRSEPERANRRRLFDAIDVVDLLRRRRQSNNTSAGHTAGALAVRLNRIAAGRGRD